MSDPKHLAVVWVEWIDSSTTGGWSTKERVLANDLRCWTCGLLVSEDDEAVTVCASYSAHESYLDAITIPKVAITKIEEIEFS